MLSEKIILDKHFIWNASIKASSTVIELSKVANQQIFLVGKDSNMLTKYFQHLNEKEVRVIDLVSNISPFSKLEDVDLLLLNLN